MSGRDDIPELLARLGVAVWRQYHRTVVWVRLELAEDAKHSIALPCPPPATLEEPKAAGGRT